MARSVGTAVENSFVEGLVTERTGLNYPENSVTEVDNCIFDKKGSVKRRLGLDYEEDYVFKQLGRNGAVNTFKWEAVSKTGNIMFIAVQSGYTVSFYDTSVSPLSDGLKAFTVDLRSYVSRSNKTDFIADEEASFSAGNGYLFIAHRFCNPVFVDYDSELDTITTTQIDIKIRDFEGLDDGLEDSDRPTTLSPEHEYNLLNQGWYGKSANKSVLHNWSTQRPDYPSNSDVWYNFKDADDEFNTEEINKYQVVNAPSAKGHYIYNAFRFNRKIDYYGSTTPAVGSAGDGTSVDSVSTGAERPTITEFYASRVWWAGVNYPKFSSKIYYSKAIEKDTDFGVCHQVNDPTSPDLSDLLPTDGGVINIQDIADIVYMKSVKDFIIVFATNGVWAISGSDLASFKADGYSVSKVSEVGALSPSSFIDVDGIPVWWNASGIYTLQQGEGSIFSVVSLSNDKIKTYYDSLLPESKRYARGDYDPLERTVTWLYRSTSAPTFEDNFFFDRELVLDLNTSSYTKHSYPSSGPMAMDIVNIEGLNTVKTEETLTDSALATVTDVAVDAITTYVHAEQIQPSINKYLISSDPNSTPSSAQNLGIHFALDKTGSMASDNDGTPRQKGVMLQTAMSLLLDELISFKTLYPTIRLDIDISAWADYLTGGNTEWIDASTADMGDMKTQINAFNFTGGTHFNAAMEPAVEFFEEYKNVTEIPRRVFFFVTDGLPTVPTIGQESVTYALNTMNAVNLPSYVEIYAFQIEETDDQYIAQIDQTPFDHVPIIGEFESTRMAELMRSILIPPVLGWDSTYYTWGDRRDTTYRDFAAFHPPTSDNFGPGLNFDSTFSTGYRLRGEGQRDFQNNYMTIVSKADSNTSFFISGRWDYGTSDSIRNTTRQEGYKHRDYADFCSRKIKMRGTGKVLQYRVESAESASFDISGWITYDSVNTSV